MAGSDRESIVQPRWSPDGTLYFVSDRTGWWNLYRLVGDRVEAVCPMAAEFGRPMWQLGTSTWAFAGPLRLVAAYALKGRWQLATIDLATGAFAPVATDLEPADSLAATHTHAVMVGGSARQPDGVLRVDLATGAVETIRAASTFQSAERDVSIAEAIEFATGEGLAAHATRCLHRLGRRVPDLRRVAHGETRHGTGEPRVNADDHGRAAQALSMAQKAAELAPGRAAVLDTYATALAKASRCADAVRVEERAVELTAEHASGELRRRLLARLDSMRAGCADVPLEDE